MTGLSTPATADTADPAALPPPRQSPGRRVSAWLYPRLFASEGARIAVTDVNLDAARQVAAECNSLTPGSIALACDVSKSSSVKEAFSASDRELGELDVLVNNAGIIHTDPAYLDVVDRQGRWQQLKSVIQIVLPGGMAHQESWDPKPDAPLEYRGPDLWNHRGLLASNGILHDDVLAKIRPIFPER